MKFPSLLMGYAYDPVCLYLSVPPLFDECSNLPSFLFFDLCRYSFPPSIVFKFRDQVDWSQKQLYVCLVSYLVGCERFRLTCHRQCGFLRLHGLVWRVVWDRVPLWMCPVFRQVCTRNVETKNNDYLTFARFTDRWPLTRLFNTM